MNEEEVINVLKNAEYNHVISEEEILETLENTQYNYALSDNLRDAIRGLLELYKNKED